MNVENEREETDTINKTEGSLLYVTREEMKIAQSKMSKGKYCGASEVSAELLNVLGIYLLHFIMKDVWNRGNIIFQMGGERAKWCQNTG